MVSRASAATAKGSGGPGRVMFSTCTPLPAECNPDNTPAGQLRSYGQSLKG